MKLTEEQKQQVIELGDLQGFESFIVLDSKEDPEVPGVFLVQIDFNVGDFGLCIWDSNRNHFIEEPADYFEYDMTETDVTIRYGFQHDFHFLILTDWEDDLDVDKINEGLDYIFNRGSKPIMYEATTNLEDVSAHIISSKDNLTQEELTEIVTQLQTTYKVTPKK